MIVISVNGCCYGRSTDNLKTGEYFKYCGQRFWEFITGMPDLYLNIIEPLGAKAKEQNENFNIRYNALLNTLSHQFMHKYCDASGIVDWAKIVRMNSGVSLS